MSKIEDKASAPKTQIVEAVEQSSAAPAPVDIATPLATALDYAKKGWPVFPCNPKESTDPRKKGQPDKKPLTKNGFQDATTDLMKVRNWWEKWPDALIGIPTGAYSGIVVLDSDIERNGKGKLIKDGEGNLQAEMARRGWTLPETMHAITARGGMHRLFKFVPGTKCSTDVIPNVDVRGAGGYFIAPGSRGRVGGPWVWGSVDGYENMSDILEAIEEAPEWLARIFQEGKGWDAESKEKAKQKNTPPADEPETAQDQTDDSDDPFAEMDSTNADDIRRALAGVNEKGEPLWDADSYNDYAHVAIALHRHAEGRELWEEWAQTSSKYDADEAEKKWDETVPKKNITARSILHRVPHDTLSAWARERTIAEGSSGGDIGNAKAFARRFHGELACLHPEGKYMRWTGSRWARCETGEEVEAAKELAQDIVREAISRIQNGGGSKEDETRLRSATTLRNSASKLKAMLELAKSDPLIKKHQREFDCDPWLLGVQNGVLDLRTGRLVPPNPEQSIMRQAGAPFIPGAQCPRWLKFLEDVQSDPEVRAFLQRAVGYTLTGLTDEEKFFFLVGEGSNGKSVFATALAWLMGDYHVTIAAGALAKNKHGTNSEADRAMARLPGARLALANETAQGSIWDDQKLKELASRDAIAARKLFSESFDFTPSHALWIRGNHLPGAHDAGDGFWRRLIAVPFKVKFGEDQKVPDLDRQLFDAEKAGILAWAVEGCLAWQRGGQKLDVPLVLRERTATYRQDTDILGQWLEECLVADPQGRVTAAEAYRSFTDYYKEQGMKAPAQRTFGVQLGERGICSTKGTGGRRDYVGYRLVVSNDFEVVDDLGGGSRR